MACRAILHCWNCKVMVVIVGNENVDGKGAGGTKVLQMERNFLQTGLEESSNLIFKSANVLLEHMRSTFFIYLLILLKKHVRITCY